MKLFLCLLILISTDFSSGYDYLRNVMNNCTTGLPMKNPEDIGEGIGQEYKDCATELTDDHFCTNLCQLRLRSHLSCVEYDNSARCYFGVPMVEADFVNHSGVDIDDVSPASLEIQERFGNPSPPINAQEVCDKLIQNVYDRMPSCLPEMPFFVATANLEEGCHKLSADDRKPFENILRCFEKAWAECLSPV